MKSISNIFITSTIFLVLSVTSCTKFVDNKKSVNEIIEIEASFAAAAEKNGLSAAFYEYAAPDAVIHRGELIKGREAIKSFYEPMDKSGVKLNWKPDYVFVSSSGDLAYSYGGFDRMTSDSTGHISKTSGIFHTVWKKQGDGTWKFVWD